jgi:hypothetical protein
MAVKTLGSGKVNADPPSVARSLAGAAQPPAPVAGGPFQLPGAMPPSQVGTVVPPSLNLSAMGTPPLPPSRPPALGMAASAAPAAAARGSSFPLASNPPLPPVRPQDLGQDPSQNPLQALFGGLFGGGGQPQGYPPVQASSVQNGAPVAYASPGLGDLLSRIFGRA